jgi:aspartyl-tRNA(Asn)/glutamyl-tRNA(Gln) amidotransferase subunit B
MSIAGGSTPASAEALANYEPVIGLEVHVQLQTQSKIFCGCSTRFGDPPNTNVCPVCLGLPGALPVLNRAAAEMAVKAALALNCRVNRFSRFARKNYFYPDLPKGYQISQYDQPLAEHGYLAVRAEDGERRIGITRIHLEDDAGKSIHDGFPDSGRASYVDLNRSGVPLIEIVSEPDIRSSAEAYDYLTRLKEILLYLEVSDCNMEEGSLRCDANVSVRPRGSAGFGVKAEVKNLNSFRYLRDALDYEISRQVAVIEGGGTLLQETRLWNLDQQVTVGMRSKEQAHDYRYFPEPDLPPLLVDEAWEQRVRLTLPELPAAKRQRFLKEYGLREYDAGVLTATRALADYYEAAARTAGDPRAAANWVQGDLLGALNAAGKDMGQSPVSAENLGTLIRLVNEGAISGKIAKDVFVKMFAEGRAPGEIIAAEGLAQISDSAQLQAIIREVMAANPKQVESYRGGKTGVFAFFVGQVMKATRGQANPTVVNDLLRKQLDRKE